MKKSQRQDGYLNDADKEKMEDLQRKISARENSDENKVTDWTVNHDLLYSLLCISFFADQEIDESEKSMIFKSYSDFIDDVTDNSFNIDFGMTTNKFIGLKTESSRQAYFDYSLLNLKETKQFKKAQLLEIIQAFINIANADDFIHEKEVILIQHAINIWELDARVDKPKSGKKLELKN